MRRTPERCSQVARSLTLRMFSALLALLACTALAWVVEITLKNSFVDKFRNRATIAVNFIVDKNLDVGFWGDLGWDRKHPEAFTVFLATPLLEDHRASSEPRQRKEVKKKSARPRR